MSSEENPTGSEDGVVSFEELDENRGNSGEFAQGSHYPKGAKTYKCPPGYAYDAGKKTCVKVKADASGPETCDLQEMTPDELAEFAQGYKYPSAGSKTYKCPPGYAWDPAKKSCVKVQKDVSGPEEAALVEVIEERQGQSQAQSAPASAMAAGKDKGPYSCPAGEVFDPKKKECVPAQEALSERDVEISDLTKRLQNVESTLRMKNIEIVVDEQIAGGHLAPVQRGKAIAFLAGIPDDKHSDLLGIFQHQKFPLKEETGATLSAAPGAGKKGIGEADSAKDLSPEDREVLKKRFKMDELYSEFGKKVA